MSWILPRIVGLGRANELLYSSRVILAEEAERIGLVNVVTPPKELLDHTYQYVRNLVATVSPRSLRETKRQVYTDLHRDVGSSVDESDELIREMMREPAFAEGVRAYLERRLPNWPDAEPGPAGPAGPVATS